MSNKIFVGNLDFGITDGELRELLSEVGEEEHQRKTQVRLGAGSVFVEGHF